MCIYTYIHIMCVYIYIYIYTHTLVVLYRHHAPRHQRWQWAESVASQLEPRITKRESLQPYVCMYVYIYIYTHLCIYLYLSLYIYISTYTSYIYIYICSYRVTLICIYIYIYIHMQQRQISTTTVNDSHGANDESLSGTQEIERGRDSACMMLVKIELHSLRGTKGGPKEGSLNIGRHGV